MREPLALVRDGFPLSLWTRNSVPLAAQRSRLSKRVLLSILAAVLVGIWFWTTSRSRRLTKSHDGRRAPDTGTARSDAVVVAPPGASFLVKAAYTAVNWGIHEAAWLTVARVGDRRELTVVATGETTPGARNAVADGNGNVYVADSQGAHLLLFRVSQP